MELQVKPSPHNKFPLQGILIKGVSALYWLQEIQRMGFSLDQVQVFPLPSKELNSVWGCLVTMPKEQKHLDISPHAYCQLAYHLLFLPERADIFPTLSLEELGRLFLQKKHIFHPDFGWVELSEYLEWSTLLQLPDALPTQAIQPKLAPYIPTAIRGFQVYSGGAKEVLENMENNLFPHKSELENQPLTPAEKGKLWLLKQLFQPGNNSNSAGRGRPIGGSSDGGYGGGFSGGSGFSGLEKLFGLFFGIDAAFTQKLRASMEELEKRNQKQVDRLLDLFKNDPFEALKYAIPLDSDGVTRGPSSAEMGFGLQWLNFSIFGNGSHSSSGGSGGNAPLSTDSFDQLRKQYIQTAEDLIKKKEYLKAAFVYMKLLKDYYLAAQTLEKGKHYAEAAAVYLNFLQNKYKAAECYEKGNMFKEAIALYIELNMNERAGDLYLRIHKKGNAMKQYQIVVDQYVQAHQYVKAALLCRTKMENSDSCQHLLLEGWRLNHDAFNCLNNYFAHIQDVKVLGEHIQNVYANDVNLYNRTAFLKVLQYEFAKENAAAEDIKKIAYEIIVAETPRNPAILGELKQFNPKDKLLVNDTMRYPLASKSK
jgi:MoxR-vWA-beta-propeller ternary system domain bpX3